MNIVHSFGAISGWSFRDVYGIAQRYSGDSGFTPEAGESWIVKNVPADGSAVLWTCMYKPILFTGIWRSLEDKVYVAEIGGTVLHGPLAPGEVWPERRVGFTLSGIWGLDDEHVYVWGLDGKTPAMARWDGQQWKRVDSPEFQVVDLYGLSPDLLVAVGAHGRIARWDGRRWNVADSGTRKSLSSVFVATPDEMYACGHDGALVQGSAQGWHVVLDDAVQKPCVAKWRDEVYVGTYGELGLCKLEGGALSSFKPKVQAVTLDVRRDLVASTPGAIAGTDNGVNYQAMFIQAFVDATAQLPPVW